VCSLKGIGSQNIYDIHNDITPKLYCVNTAINPQRTTLIASFLRLNTKFIGIISDLFEERNTKKEEKGVASKELEQH